MSSFIGATYTSTFGYACDPIEMVTGPILHPVILRSLPAAACNTTLFKTDGFGIKDSYSLSDIIVTWAAMSMTASTGTLLMSTFILIFDNDLILLINIPSVGFISIGRPSAWVKAWPIALPPSRFPLFWGS